jgi:two-component system nitrogen regulation response regulator GlnG
LVAHDWPGNIRELQNVLERAVILSGGTMVEVQPLVSRSARGPRDLDLEAFIRERLLSDADDLYASTHGRVDRLLLGLALDHKRGNHRDAARLLGISRQTLRMKLRALGLQPPRSNAPAPIHAGGCGPLSTRAAGTPVVQYSAKYC